MKAIKAIGFFTLFLTLSLLTFSCGGSTEASTEGDATEAVHGEGKEYTSAYVCPMHCEGSGSEEMGQCPVCGMDYVAQADHVKDEHSH